LCLVLPTFYIVVVDTFYIVVVDIRTYCYTRTRPHVEASGRRSSNQSDRYVLPVRPVCGLRRLNQKYPFWEGPVREEASWVDLASAGQLDPPPSATGMKGDKKLWFGKEELGFGDKK
jgi:hypothetical protein